jgi:hypothetical protein
MIRVRTMRDSSPRPATCPISIAAAACCLLVAGFPPPTAADDAFGPESGPTRACPVRLRLLGGDEQEPLAGVEVLLTNGYGDAQVRFGPFTTDDTGTATAVLPPAFYSLHLSSEREWRYLHVETSWSGRPRRHTPSLNLRVTDCGAEKWLDGTQRDDGYEPPTRPGDTPRITYTLLRACELVLRAVDAKMGKGLPGVEFYEENALGEEWAHAIDGDNLGWRAVADEAPGAAALNRTDQHGNFIRLVGATGGYAYGVARPPAGYEAVDPGREFDLDIPFGQSRAEQVFRFRRIVEHPPR